MELTLYSVFHKPFIQPATDFVKPIHAGKAISKEKLSIIGDDTGDNISALNHYFCELTAMYWIWKNSERKENYWGLCHYRRYFTMPIKRFLKKPKALLDANATQQEMDRYVNDKLETLMIDLLLKHDVILQTPIYLYKRKGVIKTVGEHYREDHIREHWEIMKEKLIAMYPGYENSFYSFEKAQKISFFNMAVGNWKFWDDYLNWLFPLLFAIQPMIKLTGDPYQDRVFGYLSERLINLYVWHNKLKVAYLPVVAFK